MTWKQAAQKAQRDKVKPIPEGWSTRAMIAKAIGATSPDSRSVSVTISRIKPERKQWLTVDKSGRVNHCIIYKDP